MFPIEELFLYNKKYVISYWSFEIVLSSFDSAHAPLVISHHWWDFPHRW
jgi:hypothetical protein